MIQIGNRIGAKGLSKVLESLMAKDPQNIDVAQYLIKAYLENNNRKKAGETLKI